MAVHAGLGVVALATAHGTDFAGQDAGREAAMTVALVDAAVLDGARAAAAEPVNDAVAEPDSAETLDLAWATFDPFLDGRSSPRPRTPRRRRA